MKQFIFGFWLGVLVGLILVYSVFIKEDTKEEHNYITISDWKEWKQGHELKPWK